MSAHLLWDYVGGANGSAEAQLRGPQSAMPNDDGYDDVLGPCKLAGIDGAMMRCIFHEEGKDVVRERTKGHVRVVVQRGPGPAQPRAVPVRRHVRARPGDPFLFAGQRDAA